MFVARYARLTPGFRPGPGSILASTFKFSLATHYIGLLRLQSGLGRTVYYSARYHLGTTSLRLGPFITMRGTASVPLGPSGASSSLRAFFLVTRRWCLSTLRRPKISSGSAKSVGVCRVRSRPPAACSAGPGRQIPSTKSPQSLACGGSHRQCCRIKHLQKVLQFHSEVGVSHDRLQVWEVLRTGCKVSGEAFSPSAPAPSSLSPVPCPKFPVLSSLFQVLRFQFAAPSSPEFPVPSPLFQFPVPSSLSPVCCPRVWAP